MATRPEHASNTRKRALIICNYEYKQSNCSLNYVRGNAEKLQDQLESIGFHVKKEMNVDNSIMDIFQNLQKEVQKGDLVLVYFFGLSCHVDNQNYLLAVGVYDDKDDILDKSNDAERMITRLVEETQANAIVFILDCCKPYELKSVGDPECKSRSVISVLSY